MSRLLESYAAGRWFTAEDEGRPLLDASTGEEVFRSSAQGLDLGEMTSYARTVGGPALRALHLPRAGRDAQGAREAPDGHVAEFHELSLLTGATKGDGMGDIEGGIGTLFASGSVGTRQLPNDTVYLDGDPIPLGKGGTFVGQHVFTSRPGVMVQINAFNFPVWGMLEKLGPAFLAGMPSIVKPAARRRTSPRRSSAAWSRPASCRRARSSSSWAARPGCSTSCQVQDHVAFTGSAHTAGLLRTHANVLHGGVTLGVEADSLNCSILGPDVTADDPELDLFVKGVVTEMTYKAGQKCTSIRRALVPAPMVDTVIEALTARLARTTVGHPAAEGVRMGALVSLDQREEVRKAIQSLRASAEVVYGDPDHADRSDRRRRASGARSSGRCCSAPTRARSSRTTSRLRAGQHRDRLRHRRRRHRAGRAAARAAWPGRWSPTTPRSRGPSRSAWPRGTAGSWSSTATTPASPPATAYPCRRSSTAARAGPAAARRWAGSAASCT